MKGQKNMDHEHQKKLKTLPIISMFVFLSAFLASTPDKSEIYMTPVYQSALASEAAGKPLPLSLQDAAREDRCFGAEVSSVSWAPDGKSIYFRWNLNPSADQDPRLDPWFRVDSSGKTVEKVADSASHLIPSADLSWSQKGKRAVWVRNGNLYFYDSSAKNPIRLIFDVERPVRSARILPDGLKVHFMVGEDLFLYEVEAGTVRQLTRKYTKPADKKTQAAEWLEKQQKELFERIRDAKKRREELEAFRRKTDAFPAQPIPVDKGVTLEDVSLSPDGRFVIFRLQKSGGEHVSTKYLDYATESGYAEVQEARPKVGEEQDSYRMGIVPYDPAIDPDEIKVTWVDYSKIDKNSAIIYGPYWSLEGDRALVQVVSLGHKDRWICKLDLKTGLTELITYDHDDAWLGGPPPVAGFLRPALLEWLPGGRFVFASERTGWSHLYLTEPDGTIRPLTQGEWEVRDAQLNRERTTWLITASREHPSDDHLYIMPAQGGELVRLTKKAGRHAGTFSPDGKRLAVIYSESIQLPDLFVQEAKPGSPEIRITVSGSDNYYRHSWVRPEVVSFPHQDGGLVWASLFKPEKPTSERAAIIHIHGGGYRQFSHRGWSVYGYASHIGLINYLVQQGYTVLDLDYRGSAGFGRNYRIDIYRSMGVKDVASAVAAVDYLVKGQDIDRTRVGLYGISYGGFLTLMSLFRAPGVFAAGVANASVTDWAHYNHLWTSRILNLTYEDPEAYQISSPINHASGLKDPLLILHGLIDENVQFQDAARLIQKLIELDKEFEVMVYPMERHGFRSESSRTDYCRRAVAFFERHLLRK